LWTHLHDVHLFAPKGNPLYNRLWRMRVEYRFEWDPAKESANVRKHRVSFRRATSVFRDPNQLSIHDEQHSDVEDRWITIGIDDIGVPRVVVHTFKKVDPNLCVIRIISARKATTGELQEYGREDR